MTAASPSFLIRRLSRGQLLAIDVLLAVATTVLGGYAAAETPQAPQAGWAEPGWVSFLLGVALGLPVAVRRLWPVVATAAVLTVAAIAVVTGAIPSYAGVAPIVALGLTLYTVGVELPRRRSLTVAAAGVLGIVVMFAVVTSEPFELLFVGWVVAAGWATGRTMRERRAHAASRAEQATALAVEQERLRLARELHDIVAHSMSMIAIKAAVADHVGDDRPEEMRAALRVIGTTSRQSLGEIRRALALVRTEATMRPAPGLADLDELAESARSTGLTVAIEVRLDEEIPSDVALSAYRIVQEALTNVVKHSGAAGCRIEIEGTPGEVRIWVTDDGAVPGGGKAATTTPGGGKAAIATPGSGVAAIAASGRGEVPVGEARGTGVVGQGLIGMRERVAQFGGEFGAGPGVAGGWVVEATLRFVL